MKKSWLIFVLVLLAGCNGTAPEDSLADAKETHLAFIEGFGWHVKEYQGERKHVEGTFGYVTEAPEYAHDTLDLEPYINEITYSYSYLLAEEYPKGESLFATIYEHDGEIIGGELIQGETTPGRGSLNRPEIPKLPDS
ncbi:protein of unknown function [Evansella caseinilytica]|uniref:Uncharacterized protein n=1 Tax=Evansella caseinilytica TaxID=1503961 RepID=A0A1H3QJU8_9BACI|nr:DUF4830 domain-containing protein [Evansella caseinilytica]SDZ13245.1 protein of unknown function [Evansella caseinilytica]